MPPAVTTCLFGALQALLHMLAQAPAVMSRIPLKARVRDKTETQLTRELPISSPPKWPAKVTRAHNEGWLPLDVHSSGSVIDIEWSELESQSIFIHLFPTFGCQLVSSAVVTDLDGVGSSSTTIMDSIDLD